MSGRGPLPRPCVTCPYRRDVPSGLWHPEEYAKLPEYDKETGEQPHLAFGCHQANGHFCSGWVSVHDMENNLAVRLEMAFHRLTPEEYEEVLAYVSPVPCFESGDEAFRHGMEHISDPDSRARAAQIKLLRQVGRNTRRREQ